MNVRDYTNRILNSDLDMSGMQSYEPPSEEELNRPYIFWDLLDFLIGAL